MDLLCLIMYLSLSLHIRYNKKKKNFFTKNERGSLVSTLKLFISRKEKYTFIKKKGSPSFLILQILGLKSSSIHNALIFSLDRNQVYQLT